MPAEASPAMASPAIDGHGDRQEHREDEGERGRREQHAVVEHLAQQRRPGTGRGAMPVALRKMPTTTGSPGEEGDGHPGARTAQQLRQLDADHEPSSGTEPVGAGRTWPLGGARGDGRGDGSGSTLASDARAPPVSPRNTSSRVGRSWASPDAQALADEQAVDRLRRLAVEVHPQVVLVEPLDRSCGGCAGRRRPPRRRATRSAAGRSAPAGRPRGPGRRACRWPSSPARVQISSTSASRWLDRKTVVPSWTSSTKRVLQLVDALRVEPVGGLVEDEQAGPAQEGGGQAQPLAHAHRVGLDRAAADVGEAHPLEGPPRCAGVGCPARRCVRRRRTGGGSGGRRGGGRSRAPRPARPRRASASLRDGARAGRAPRPSRWSGRPGRAACGWSCSCRRRSDRGSRRGRPRTPRGRGGRRRPGPPGTAW